MGRWETGLFLHHSGGGVLPIRRLSLRVPLPRPAYPTEPRTIGEHLKRRRLDLGLTQREAADALSANVATLYLGEEPQGTGPQAPARHHPLPGLRPAGWLTPAPAPEERLRQLDEAFPRLQGEIDYLKVSLLNKAEVISEARDLYQRFGDLPFEDRRTVVEATVECITIGREESSSRTPLSLRFPR